MVLHGKPIVWIPEVELLKNWIKLRNANVDKSIQKVFTRDTLIGSSKDTPRKIIKVEKVVWRNSGKFQKTGYYSCCNAATDNLAKKSFWWIIINNQQVTVCIY